MQLQISTSEVFFDDSTASLEFAREHPATMIDPTFADPPEPLPRRPHPNEFDLAQGR